MRHLSAPELVAAVRGIQADRDHLLHLIGQVADAVLDKAQDGMSVAYLPAELLAEIRARLR